MTYIHSFAASHIFFLSMLSIITVLKNEVPGENNFESDIMLHLWPYLLSGDVQFSCNKSFKCHKGEITCLISSFRRCQQSTAKVTAKKVGKRADILIRSGNTDFAYGEAILKTSPDDKYSLYDSILKMMKIVEDILMQLSHQGNDNMKLQLRTVGYEFSKFTITILYMDYIGKHRVIAL